MKYARAMLKNVEAYVPGRQPGSTDIIKLNTNENPYPPSDKVLEAIRAQAAAGLRRYPEAQCLRLREACAECYGLPDAGWIIAGNGMDELLAMAIRTFTDPGDAVVTVYPTYTLYETLARLHGARYVTVELGADFQMPESLYGHQGRLCLITRPNAPSGVASSRQEMERLCESFGGLVVIDEAYADFAEDNCLDFPERFENAIVMRTFSKSFSLAGLRLGIAAARPEIIAELMKTKDSYNVNGVTQAAGLAALDDLAHMETNVAKIRATRDRLTRGLVEMGFDVPPSGANFVLAQFTENPSAHHVYDALCERGIYVRYFDTPRLENALRISVGTEDETDALLAALNEILGG